MGLQPLRGERLAFEVDDQRCGWTAVEGEPGPALQIALQDRCRPAHDRRNAGPAAHDRLVLDRNLAEPQNADRLCRAAGDAQLAQQLLLAAEKTLAQKCQPKRLEASRRLARKSFGKGPSVVDCRLDLCRGTVVAEIDTHSAHALDAQQRIADIFDHQIGEIDRAPAGRQAQRDADMARTELQRAHKAQIEDRLVQLGVEHLRQPLQHSRAVIARGELTWYVVAHGLRASSRPTGCAASASRARQSGARGKSRRRACFIYRGPCASAPRRRMCDGIASVSGAAGLASERVERRLTAILAADVAGYSRLMGVDEEGTLAGLKAHRRELVDPKIAEHRGRIVKTAGDGLLAEFVSVVDAVRCAVEIQREMVGRNAVVPPDRRIEFRVGINLGDIISEEGDIFGDGVNVAARLEALAEPGGICVNRVVRDQVRDKLALAFEDLGEQQVKNIARPVRAYRVLTDAAIPAATSAARRRLPRWAVAAGIAAFLILAGGAAGVWHLYPVHPAATVAGAPARTPALPDKPSIAVLPFANLSGDPAQDYLADGLTDNLLDALAQNPRS